MCAFPMTSPLLPEPVSHPFDALSPALLNVIMLALPVDARAICAAVCRGWRALLADAVLWQVLDLSPAGGVPEERVTPALVRGAAARAAGQLRSLSMNVHGELLLELLAANGELRVVNLVGEPLRAGFLQAVLGVAPQLQLLEVPVRGFAAELLPVLRKEQPYGALRVTHVFASFNTTTSHAEHFEVAAALAAHPWVDELFLYGVRSEEPAVLNALLDAAARARVSMFSVVQCRILAEHLPALARLLRCGSLKKLDMIGLFNVVFPMDDESMAQLCAALRACGTLTHLEFWGYETWRPDNHHIIVDFLNAAAAMPALSILDLSCCVAVTGHKAAAGQALGALLAANSPSLRTLSVGRCHLGDDGLAMLLAGLAANTHLRKLHCGNNNPSEAFKRQLLQPALAALAARSDPSAPRA